MNRQEFHQSLEATFRQCLEISEKKNADYATGSDPFNNFNRIETLGICSVQQGILVRLTDKLARVSNLIGSGKGPSVKDESIDDTILDAINYLAILRAYRQFEAEQAATLSGYEPYVKS